jgi:hypothetical protein
VCARRVATVQGNLGCCTAAARARRRGVRPVPSGTAARGRDTSRYTVQGIYDVYESHLFNDSRQTALLNTACSSERADRETSTPITVPARTEERSRPREPGAGRDGLAPGTGGLSGLSDRALGSRSRSRTRWRGSSTVVDVSCLSRVGMGIFYVPGMRVCMCSRHAMCVSSTHPLSIN